MKISPLALLIGGALISQSALAETTTLAEISAHIQTQLQVMQQLAQKGTDVTEKDGDRYLTYKGNTYSLNHENYPRFPFNDVTGAYSNAFPLISNEWDFLSESGGFFLLHRENGVLNPDETGCFYRYSPAGRGSQRPDGSYVWETAMVQETITSDCGDLSQPNLSSIQAASLSDVGVQLTWDDSGDTEYNIALTARRDGESPITINYKATSPGFYIGDLDPSTTYDVEISGCNLLDCGSGTFSFTTLPSRLGFNDSRQADNHLAGDLRAHVNFAQTHTSVSGYGNEELGHPNLVMSREAQLLVTPSQRNVNQLWVDVEVDGVSMGRFAMTPPSAQPDTDQPNNGRPKVIFSHYAWSFPLSWEWMKPGLSLRFSDNQGREGDLTSDMLVFAGAPELIIQNIDIGMLVEPRDQYTMIDNMAQLATDYFQKIPVSKMVMADYTPVHLRKVTMPNGKIYTKASEDENPGWLGGDMREFIGKRLYSIGINNANFGVTDTAGGSAHWPRPFSHITAHNSRGVYLAKNKETGIISTQMIQHGGSGGGGIVTLSSTTGNQWSHELAHNYGRWHYPDWASIHDMESGWGWDARYNRFIGNLHWKAGTYVATVPQGQEDEVEPFANEFSFMFEAMAGGEKQRTGIISDYILEHPKGTRVTQDWFNKSNNLDMDSSTGYSRWDHASQQYVEAETTFAKPLEKGVPVITVLGFYDPALQHASQIYPLIYSNYGNLFELPEPQPFSPQLEGWYPVANMSDADRFATTWHTMKINNAKETICQFSYTNGNGVTANFVGYEDLAQNVCRTADSNFWLVNGVKEKPQSAPMDYQLLSTKGNLLTNVTYAPTPELGEQTLCTLDKPGTSHEGAGFLINGRCQQVADFKQSNGGNWLYSTHQGGVIQYSQSMQGQCEMIIEHENGSEQRIGLAGMRHNNRESNKFHFNLPMDNHPSRITVNCTDSDLNVSMLDSVTTPRNPAVNELVGPMFVGQEHGYKVFESGLEPGWFAHNEGFDPAALSEKTQANLVSMKVGESRPYLCRFPMAINGIEKTLHGFVEDLGNGDFQCTGGDELYVKDNNGQRPLLSQLNQFEWLSSVNRDKVTEHVKATDDSDAKLCVIENRGDWYGAGFVNANNQCTQVPGVHWSNGNHWLVSGGFVQPTFR